jgi:hypothetical protein
MRPDEGELRRPDELALLYELEPDVRDVIVEGRGDKSFFDWFISEEQSNGLVRVYAVSDRAYLPDSDLIENGLLTGERSRVLHLSKLLSEMGVNSDSVRLVIDSDFHSIGLDGYIENGYLLRTDFSSIEVYAFNQQTINKLLRVGLSAPGEVTAENLIESVQPTLVTLFIIRACLRESRTGAPMPAKAVEKVYRSRNDAASAVEEVLRLALDKVPKAQKNHVTKDFLMQSFRELEKLVAGDMRHFINGHDISESIVQYIKERCKSVFNGDSRRAFQAPSVMEVLLMSHIDRATLRDYPLFISIRRWLTCEEGTEGPCPLQ